MRSTSQLKTQHYHVKAFGNTKHLHVKTTRSFKMSYKDVHIVHKHKFV